MRLQNSIIKMLEIERRIYEDGGELTPASEMDLDRINDEIAKNIEATVFAYQRRAQELAYIKNAYKNVIKSRGEQLNMFKNLIHDSVKIVGKLETPIAYIAHRERKVKEVVIWDFDKVVTACPDAVTYEVFDNVKTVRLNKVLLKAYWDTSDIKPFIKECGFEVKEKTVTFPDIRVRGMGKGSLVQ